MDHPRLHLGPSSTALRPSDLDVRGAPGDVATAGTSWTSLLVHGSFFLATCARCEWTGSARRARDTALRDGVRHRQVCPGPVL